MPMSPFKYICSIHSAKGIWVTWSKVLGWQCLGGAGGTGTTLETNPKAAVLPSAYCAGAGCSLTVQGRQGLGVSCPTSSAL